MSSFADSCLRLRKMLTIQWTVLMCVLLWFCRECKMPFAIWSVRKYILVVSRLDLLYLLAHSSTNQFSAPPDDAMSSWLVEYVFYHRVVWGRWVVDDLCFGQPRDSALDGWELNWTTLCNNRRINQTTLYWTFFCWFYAIPFYSLENVSALL